MAAMALVAVGCEIPNSVAALLKLDVSTTRTKRSAELVLSIGVKGKVNACGQRNSSYARAWVLTAHHTGDHCLHLNEECAMAKMKAAQAAVMVMEKEGVTQV
jgi:hypothetical protein